MPTKVIMPRLGESVEEGTISKWLISRGQDVNEFDPLLEVNTDKVDTEIPSPASGILLEILIPEGTTVQAGTLLAWIGEPGENLPENGEGIIKAELVPTMAETKVTAGLEPHPEPIPLTPGRDRELGFISPVVARIASKHQIDLKRVNGSGQGGRITKKDVLVYLESHQGSQVKTPAALPEIASVPVRETPAVSEVPLRQTVSPPSPGEVVALSPVRKSIADHMVFSKHTSPHVTTVMEVDLSRVVAHRQSNKEQLSNAGVNLTFSAYFIAASVAALKAFPIVNSSWSDEGIVIHREINIGVATSLGEEGLIVPVIKNADSLSLLGLARSINDLANRARNRQLKPDEVKSGTFTITNHGISGSLFATPIINQPQCAILGVGAIQKRVVVIDDAIAIRPMVFLSLTFDHRILDGAIADYFLAKVVEYLQNWQE